MHHTPELSGLKDADSPIRDCVHLREGGMHENDADRELVHRHLGTGPMPIPQEMIHFCLIHGLRMCGSCAEGHKLTCTGGQS